VSGRALPNAAALALALPDFPFAFPFAVGPCSFPLAPVGNAALPGPGRTTATAEPLLLLLPPLALFSSSSVAADAAPAVKVAKSWSNCLLSSVAAMVARWEACGSVVQKHTTPHKRSTTQSKDQVVEAKCSPNPLCAHTNSTLVGICL
jgi:hypothetical protein